MDKLLFVPNFINPFVLALITTHLHLAQHNSKVKKCKVDLFLIGDILISINYNSRLLRVQENHFFTTPI